MARYKLLGGQFVADDKSRPLKDADGKPIPGRFEKQVFTARGGNQPVIESDTDLVAKFGANQFERVSGDQSTTDELDRLRKRVAELEAAKTPGSPTPDNLLHSPAVAPGGQVSSGFQANGGPLDPAQAERAGVAGLEGAKDAGGKDAGGKGKARDFDKEYGDLDAMTVAELRELAEAEEIDLGGAHRKDEILTAIRSSKRGQ